MNGPEPVERAVSAHPVSQRRSRLFCTTRRETPAEAETEGYALLLRGSFVRPLATGIFSFLPIGQRVKEKVEGILREEMDAVGGQELELPVVLPGELWRESGRWQSIGDELVRFQDRAGRDMLLAMTHEEVIADLLRQAVHSYRQLPMMLYQIQTKFRDEPRARSGLIRTREFVMKDAYSAHASSEDLDAYYPRVLQAYHRIFQRAGLQVLAVQSDVGMMGGSGADEFMVVTDIGEDHLVVCDACSYGANREVAVFRKEEPPAEQQEPLEEVATPGAETIAALAELLGIPASRTAKAALFVDRERLVFAVVRGDMEVQPTKLANAVEAHMLTPAGADDLARAGIVAGYASPIGVDGVTVVVDDLVAASPNLVAGANRPGYHLRNVNFGRDYGADVVADIAAAGEGMPCVRCGAQLRVERGVEVGNTFKLGTKYSRAMGATFLDEEGRSQDIVMASYGIGVGRLIACVAERWRDEQGLIWPISVAPFQVYLVGLDLRDQDVRSAAETLYSGLTAAGVEVLYDDRDERAGVKFNDADLLGMPLRVTVSRRTLQSAAMELRRRSEGEQKLVPLDESAAAIRQELDHLRTELQLGV